MGRIENRFTPDSLETVTFGICLLAAFSKGSMHAFVTNTSPSFLASSTNVPVPDMFFLRREMRRSYLVKTAMIGAATKSRQHAQFSVNTGYEYFGSPSVRTSQSQSRVSDLRLVVFQNTTCHDQLV